LAAFVALIGTKEEDKAKVTAEKLIKETEASNIAVVTAKDQPNGPESYKLDPKADITVLVCVKGEVHANHALAADGLNAKVARQIIADAGKILN
jgi:flavin-dependent dehydrogenase